MHVNVQSIARVTEVPHMNKRGYARIGVIGVTSYVNIPTCLGINITVGHWPKSVHPVTDHFHFCSDIMSGHKKSNYELNACMAMKRAAATGSVDLQGKHQICQDL